MGMPAQDDVIAATPDRWRLTAVPQEDPTMGEHQRRDLLNDEVEQALRAYLTAVADAAPGRHERLEELPEPLGQLRTTLHRHMDTVPRSAWPRPACRSCDGRREVEVVHTIRAEGPGAGARRLCSACWGTGMSVRTMPNG